MTAVVVEAIPNTTQIFHFCDSPPFPPPLCHNTSRSPNSTSAIVTPKENMSTDFEARAGKSRKGKGSGVRSRYKNEVR